MRPENWRNEFRPGPGGGVLCGISIRIGDEWITKWDGAENTDIEPVKGGLSSAMRRAAVQWGIGRYLYRLPNQWVRIDERGRLLETPRLPETPETAPENRPTPTRRTRPVPPRAATSRAG
ncbi:Rad52/Rad22 family DNA repair protein [Rhodothermus marinus]|uniref:Rad52/Rad22 family DNA repair protein n=1 Tax=Rhodothermus marinus TaxID=29549 RepID=UPI001FB4F663|nr:Rad52/Rad22 family DNA repair protein [Rhodothermus marinus]